MKVTVLVCTRNRPEMFENCIVSILNNTYRDFEFLIVDQSSNKKTEEIVKMGLDDLDFVYRILKYGFKCLKVGRIIVRHYPISRTSEQAMFSCIRYTEIGKGAMSLKYIRCFDLAMFAITPIEVMQRMFQITQEIMHNEWFLLRNKPRILRLLHAWH